MEKTTKVRVQPLNAEAFRPYGQVLEEGKQPLLPETEEGQVAIEIQRLKLNTTRIGQLAVHFSYNQTFIPVQGSMILVVAPPPRNREAGHDAYELDYERLTAFIIEPGQAALIDKGVWHGGMTPSKECTMINVTRKDPGEGPNQVREVEGGVEWVRPRPYIEFVDIKKRDNCVIELEL